MSSDSKGARDARETSRARPILRVALPLLALVVAASLAWLRTAPLVSAHEWHEAVLRYRAIEAARRASRPRAATVLELEGASACHETLRDVLFMHARVYRSDEGWGGSGPFCGLNAREFDAVSFPAGPLQRELGAPCEPLLRRLEAFADRNEPWGHDTTRALVAISDVHWVNEAFDEALQTLSLGLRAQPPSALTNLLEHYAGRVAAYPSWSAANTGLHAPVLRELNTQVPPRDALHEDLMFNDIISAFVAEPFGRSEAREVQIDRLRVLAYVHHAPCEEGDDWRCVEPASPLPNPAAPLEGGPLETLLGLRALRASFRLSIAQEVRRRAAWVAWRGERASSLRGLILALMETRAREGEGCGAAPEGYEVHAFNGYHELREQQNPHGRARAIPYRCPGDAPLPRHVEVLGERVNAEP